VLKRDGLIQIPIEWGVGSGGMREMREMRRIN
jgi:hypothetical protein